MRRLLLAHHVVPVLRGAWQIEHVDQVMIVPAVLGVAEPSMRDLASPTDIRQPTKVVLRALVDPGLEVRLFYPVSPGDLSEAMAEVADERLQCPTTSLMFGESVLRELDREGLVSAGPSLCPLDACAVAIALILEKHCKDRLNPTQRVDGFREIRRQPAISWYVLRRWFGKQRPCLQGEDGFTRVRCARRLRSEQRRHLGTRDPERVAHDPSPRQADHDRREVGSLAPVQRSRLDRVPGGDLKGHSSAARQPD